MSFLVMTKSLFISKAKDEIRPITSLKSHNFTHKKIPFKGMHSFETCFDFIGHKHHQRQQQQLTFLDQNINSNNDNTTYTKI